MLNYDVALSFAGEQRRYVEDFATNLRRAGTRIFYDRFEQERLWGRDLIAELDRVYRKESRFVIIFISAEYRDKKWTRHELRSALAAAIEQREEYVLPVRFDDTDLDGLPPTVHYVDARLVSADQLASMLLKKIASLSAASRTVLDVWRLVRTRYAADAFSGRGSAMAGGRWNEKGTHAVYCGSSLCVAVLETAIHQVAQTGGGFTAVGAKLHLSKPATVLLERDLPAEWARIPAPDSLRKLGTDWLNSGENCVLALPSVAIPAERIYMLNPAHADFKSLTIFSEEPVNLPALKLLG
jgi:RES domain-containing protein